MLVLCQKLHISTYDSQNLTHLHLITKESPPLCSSCSWLLSIEHILCHCQALLYACWSQNQQQLALFWLHSIISDILRLIISVTVFSRMQSVHHNMSICLSSVTLICFRCYPSSVCAVALCLSIFLSNCPSVHPSVCHPPARLRALQSLRLHHYSIFIRLPAINW